MTTSPTELQQARGYFDLVEHRDRHLRIHGWMLLPEKKFERFLIFVDGTLISEAPVLERKAIAEVFPFVPHAKDSGFSVEVDVAQVQSDTLLDIRMVGISGGQPAAKMETWYSQAIAETIPIPPPKLMKRATNSDNSGLFRVSAFKSFRDYWDLVLNHADPSKIRAMLDWGCGCGRLVDLFLRLTKIENVSGCDIDAEAIAWCARSIGRAKFSVVPPAPPTGYPDSSFDLVVGNSVLTHLTRDMQRAWLAEIRRIVAPGGVFVTSVHGEAAAYFIFPDSWRKILKDGIYDKILDSNLDDIAPAKYYRGTYQTQDYTRRVFSEYFEVLAYVERGSLNFQDVVVMKKR